jgi:hypothetical protein
MSKKSVARTRRPRKPAAPPTVPEIPTLPPPTVEAFARALPSDEAVREWGRARDEVRTLALEMEELRLALDGICWRADSSVLEYNRDVAPISARVGVIQDAFLELFGPYDALVETRPAKTEAVR